MDEETQVQEYSAWNESHPWLTEHADNGEDDLDEVIRYTLDEIRFA